ncbi:Hypothetical protein SCF082_LOCUS5144 [Durusdinium trenchii]|uniref:Plastid lipid-associated protein/fibrillin conserved domain-containing protein n=1 Tax=Durusdinium trenchii TaxID=1381693 RepID=A0ABP0I3T6_9DINO
MARPASLLVLLLSAHLTFVALRRRPAQLRSWRKATEDPWREAYDAELRRNELLLEQLGEEVELPEVCEVDWKESYEKLSDCNRQIEEVLRLQSRNADESAQAHISGWSWSMGGLGGVWILWMKPAMGMKNAAFFTFQGRLPLGLQLRKQNEGRLKGAFLVEDIFPGPAAEHVWRGDILHALTVVMDRANLGIKTEDFVSSVVGGLGRWRQTIVDASFINTVEDMVDQLNSNTMLGSDTDCAGHPPSATQQKALGERLGTKRDHQILSLVLFRIPDTSPSDSDSPVKTTQQSLRRRRPIGLRGQDDPTRRVNKDECGWFVDAQCGTDGKPSVPEVPCWFFFLSLWIKWVLPEEADGRPWVGDEVEAGDGEEGSAGEKPGKPEVEAEAAGSQGEKEDGPVEPPPPKAPSQAVSGPPRAAGRVLAPGTAFARRAVRSSS